MPEPTQPKPNEGGTPDPKPDNKPDAGKPTEVDLTKIEGDDLQKVLENPNLFKLPRISEALEAQKELKKVKDQQQKDKETSLTEQKKFQELADERGKKIETLEKQVQDNHINSALTGKLHSENVVDLDGALKLVERAKLSVTDDGQVEGADQAIETLKTDKAYLFNNSNTPPVGRPSNPSNTSSSTPGRYKFKESQLTPEFYQANKKEIDEAGRLGLIEQDGPPRA